MKPSTENAPNASPSSRRSSGSAASLTPELESALKVRHRNICLVNEIHTASTDYGDVDFLTMELLEGPTLHARLSAGRLEPTEALEIARQLCAGLAEAHRIGIIHKDLKSANIILSHLPDGTPRAVITDFGLAGEAALESDDLAGTPQYMAPELWRGGAASKASDIYALGVILYEMVTGEKPFADEPSQNRLTVPPTAPSTRARHLDKRWDTTILRCLDASPAARPTDTSEVLDALSGRRSAKGSFRRPCCFWHSPASPCGSPLLKYFEPPSIRLAILPISGSADVAAIGNGALIDVANRLAHRDDPPTLVVIPASRSLENDVHTPEQARQNLDATHALQITLHREGDDLLARGAVIDLATQTRLHEISGRYRMANAGDLSVALTGALSKALRLGDAAAEPLAAAATAPYLEALSFLRRDQHGFDRAIPLFRQAIRLDPRSPLPKAGLVEALVLKYGDTKEMKWIAEAEDELQAAETLNPDSVAVLLAAGRLDFSRGRYERALQNYQSVAERQPRNVEVLLRMAAVDEKLDLAKEAIEHYQKAIALEPDYYETYEEFGVFYYGRGEYENAAKQFRKVIQLAPRFINARINLGATLNDMGRDDAAAEALQASLRIKETGRALNSLAAIKAYQGRDADALILYKRALALDANNPIILLNLGDSSRRVSLDADSRLYYQRGSERALAELQNNPRSGPMRAFVGYFAARMGDARRGRQEIDQALQLEPQHKTVIRRAVVTYEVLGERDLALRSAAKATPDLLRELDRHPDLADFRRDPRFRELKAKMQNGG